VNIKNKTENFEKISEAKNGQKLIIENFTKSQIEELKKNAKPLIERKKIVDEIFKKNSLPIREIKEIGSELMNLKGRK